jgi:hypothetical protein
MFEYIRALREEEFQPQPYFSEFLAQLYLKANRTGELIMLIQHGFLQESVPLAKLLLKDSENDELRFQVGMDILKRLQEDEDVVQEFMARKKLVEAMRYATTNHCPHLVPPTSLLEASYKSGNKTLFLNAYKWLEEQGLFPTRRPGIHRSSDVDIQRYTSIYREIWGEIVEMEALQILE